MTTSDSPAPKIWGQVQTARNCLLRGPSYSQFCPKIRCQGNRGWQRKNLNDTIRQRRTKNRGQVLLHRPPLVVHSLLHKRMDALMHLYARSVDVWCAVMNSVASTRQHSSSIYALTPCASIYSTSKLDECSLDTERSTTRRSIGEVVCLSSAEVLVH